MMTLTLYSQQKKSCQNSMVFCVWLYKKIVKNISIYRILIFAVVCRIIARYCDTVLTFVTYELLKRKRGVVNGGGNRGVGGQTAKGGTVIAATVAA